MAERPVFVPLKSGSVLVEEISVSFKWNPGFAPVQKRKNVSAIHAAAKVLGYSPLLEISSKSELELGRRLSAFSLRIEVPGVGEIPLECAFQGGKTFERGGPYIDLYKVHPKEARRDPRLRESGNLKGFLFGDTEFPLRPRTAFYDWLYISALFEHREYLRRLHSYAGFTDVEFNPKKSLNCQARSCATLVSLQLRGQLQDAMESPRTFIQVLSGSFRDRAGAQTEDQGTLFHS